MKRRQKVAVRVYTKKVSQNNKKQKNFYKDSENICSKEHSRVLVFDTETTIDEFQNLKFGSFLIAENGVIVLRGLFYEPSNVSKKEERILKKYSKENDLSLYTRIEFIEKILFPELLKLETLCIGFNLPFDLSRLAIHFGSARGSHRGWFSLKLSENKLLPRIRIKHINSRMSFISLVKTMITKSPYDNFKGHFLELKTLSSILSEDKHINLRVAGEFFMCNCLKNNAEEHGKINEEYIDYNLKDVEATYELYLKILEHLKIYGIDIPITKIYSSASLGKYALRQMGIQPSSRINQGINAKTKGRLMSAYFGGRCEVRLRKTPIEVSVLDFLSMYPSLSINMGLWKFIIAEKIEEVDVTEEINQLLKNISLNTLRNKEIWKHFNVLVELNPNNDLLPIRSNYLDNSNIYNVGINYLNHNDSLYYALPDVIASVLLTGKVPKIKRAIRFIPIGKQSTLKKTRILDIEVNPIKDNFIKILIERRQEFKDKRNKYGKDSKEYKHNDGIQKALKILANSITYGIFIEVQPKEVTFETEVYSNKEFFTQQKYEEEGKFFNPLIAVMQVAGARLLLAMAEAYSKNHSRYVYMDTDSCFVPSNFAKKLRDLFKPLNPYKFKSDFFKIKRKKVLFYGISSKRYVLYTMDKDKINIIEYKLHGLGHLLNPFKINPNWHEEIWMDILKLHYGLISDKVIREKYSNFFAISKLTVSTPVIYKRFKTYNKGRPLSKQIKPFNFFLIGIGNKKDVKPISAFCKNSQSIVHKPFIDYKSGKQLKGLEYWRKLDDVIFQYIDHPESKFENGNKKGFMKRRHIKKPEIIYVGKETKSLELQPLEIERISEYKDFEKIKKRILKMTPREARKLGVSRPTLWRIKEKIRKQNNLNLKTKCVKKLIS